MPSPNPTSPPTSSNDFIKVHCRNSISKTVAIFGEVRAGAVQTLHLQGEWDDEEFWRNDGCEMDRHFLPHEHTWEAAIYSGFAGVRPSPGAAVLENQAISENARRDASADVAAPEDGRAPALGDLLLL